MKKNVSILGVRIDQCTPREVEQQCEEWLTRDARFHQIVTVNPEFIMEAQHNAPFRNVLATSTLATADGIGLLIASLFLYGRRLYRLTGVDLTLQLAATCANTKKRIYLLGSGAGVAKKVAQELQRLYPGLAIAGAEEGIHQVASEDTKKEAEKSEAVCKRITDASTDVLLVAFGAPKQDLWIAEHSKNLPTVRIAVGVGGTFDYVAGVVPRAPYWMRAIGFEWTYRLMTQPYRWRRIITAVIRFPLAVLASRFFAK